MKDEAPEMEDEVCTEKKTDGRFLTEKRVKHKPFCFAPLGKLITTTNLKIDVPGKRESGCFLQKRVDFSLFEYCKCIWLV